jgi:hypothetical protein
LAEGFQPNKKDDFDRNRNIHTCHLECFREKEQKRVVQHVRYITTEEEEEDENIDIVNIYYVVHCDDFPSRYILVHTLRAINLAPSEAIQYLLYAK